jgi:hypothetical protein
MSGTMMMAGGRRVGRAVPVTVGCRGSAALGPAQKNSANF